jgi:hypothetical protein
LGNLAKTVLAFVLLASIQIAIRRLARQLSIESGSVPCKRGGGGFAMTRSLYFGLRYGCCLSTILFSSIFIFSVATKAAPQDYGVEVPKVYKSALKLRVTNKKTNRKAQIESFSESILLAAPRGKAATMRIPALPVFDPKTGDYIYKVEAGMVVRELDLVLFVIGEVHPITATLTVTGQD